MAAETRESLPWSFAFWAAEAEEREGIVVAVDVDSAAAAAAAVAVGEGVGGKAGEGGVVGVVRGLGLGGEGIEAAEEKVGTAESLDVRGLL